MVRTFEGAALAQVRFPLGGIGTGCVSLGGRGELRDWEIWNHPGKGKDLPYTFFALWAQPHGGDSVARVLEARQRPPFAGGSGVPTKYAPGLPRLGGARFSATYPVARIDFDDPALPVTVALDAWNPMVPLDVEASALPVAHFRWTLTNPGVAPVAVSVAFSVLNAAGYDGHANLGNRRSGLFGKNRNAWRDEGGARGLFLTTEKYAPDHPQFGSMAVLTSHADTTYLLRWERAGWWDDLQNFWDDFKDDGQLPSDAAIGDLSPDNETDVGTLALRATIAPGASVALPFVLAWHFPNLTNTWNGDDALKGKRLGTAYGVRFTDAWDAGTHALRAAERLERETRRFVATLEESTLPAAVLDACTSQMDILRSPTCLHTEDGRFHAFEGCNDTAGCCPMNCTHVWNYEMTLAHLYPSLERTMRETDFGTNTRPSGDMAFRTLLPLSSGTLWGFVPAADGQMGTVLKLYREWKQSGDTGWLRSLWPHARRALEFAWSAENAHQWDGDGDGVMEGIQHNTYDIEFCGPNTMMGTLYLAALRAAAIMAEALGEAESAADYRARAERGATGHDALWNGEFYRQEVRFDSAAQADRLTRINNGVPLDGSEPRYQYGDGCLSDQMLGQWFAHCVGLGYVLPPDKVKATMAAVHRHNFKRDLSGHHTAQRVYALNDEGGLLLCSWPRGGRPRYPFPYADEVWTGIEYQVAAHLIYEGLIDEGLEIVQAVRDRHDGIARNPFDEFECGHHYARALASWSLLLALSGYRYSAPDAALGFAPRVLAHDFRCFFSAGSAWGLFTQTRGDGGFAASVEVRGGRLPLRSLRLSAGGSPLTVRFGDTPVAATVTEDGVTFAAPLILEPGQVLAIHS